MPTFASQKKLEADFKAADAAVRRRCETPIGRVVLRAQMIRARLLKDLHQVEEQLTGLGAAFTEPAIALAEQLLEHDVEMARAMTEGRQHWIWEPMHSKGTAPPHQRDKKPREVV